MLLRILDADAVQLSADAGWLSRLRANETSYEEGLSVREHCRRAQVGGREAVFCARVWCRAQSGESVCLVVPDATSTSYRRCVEAPQLERLARAVEDALQRRSRVKGAASCSVVRRHTTKLWRPSAADPAQPESLPWLRVEVASAALRSQAVRVIEAAARELRLLDLLLPAAAETSVEVHAELLERAGARPGGWLLASSEVWQRARSSRRSVTAAHWTLQLTREELAAASARASDAAPGPCAVRVLSFDIECYSAAHAFPLAHQAEDPVIAVAAVAKTLFAEDARERRTVVALAPLDVVPGADDVRAVASEAELLLAFARVVEESDADVVAGYNTCNFDWRYLARRGQLLLECGALTKEQHAAAFSWGRARRGSTPPEESKTSAAFGDVALCHPRMPGRVDLDLCHHLRKENSSSLPNLKLETVARHFLGEGKHDLSPQEMFKAYEEGPRGRATVAAYCLQDCALVLSLVEKLNVVPNLLEMSAVACTLPQDINFKGQQIKVYSQLLRAAHAGGYVVEDGDQAGGHDEEGYEGATVIEPSVGYYREAVLTVDFVRASENKGNSHAHGLAFLAFSLEQGLAVPLPHGDVQPFAGDAAAGGRGAGRALESAAA